MGFDQGLYDSFASAFDGPPPLREIGGLGVEIVQPPAVDPRIAKLEALINHPNTPPGERAAAHEALIRIEVGA